MSIIDGIRHATAVKAMREARFACNLKGTLAYRTGAYRLTTLTMIRNAEADVVKAANFLMDERLP